jgi:hypothetical protein
MPAIDLTKTKEYRARMEETIEANKEWLDGLGYGDADFDLKAWMVWHRMRDEHPGLDDGVDFNSNAPKFNSNAFFDEIGLETPCRH